MSDSASAKPAGASSSIRARASSPRSRGTRIVTRRSPAVSGTRPGACRGSSRPGGRCPRLASRSNSSSASRCSSVRWRGTATFTTSRWSPRPKPWSTGIPLPRSDAHVAGLRAGLQLELVVAVERRDREAAAERRLGHRQVERRDDVVPVADEPRSPGARGRGRRGRRRGRRATPACPSPGEADPLAVVDPRRDLDVDGLLLGDAAVAAARRHGRGDHLARAAARRAGLRADELAEGRVETDWSRPAPPQRPAGLGLVPGSAPEPSQASQGSETGNGTARVTPSAASTSSISISTRMSPPRPDAARPAARAEDVLAEEDREDVARGS